MFTSTFTSTSTGTDRPIPAELNGAEWGPAKHDPEHPLHRAGFGTGAALDGTVLRDGDDRRPDDN